MTSFSLAHLTVLNLPPPEMVRGHDRPAQLCGLQESHCRRATADCAFFHKDLLDRILANVVGHLLRYRRVSFTSIAGL